MSWQAVTWATRCRVGDASEKLLLMTLANYANEDGESWYSQERLSYDTEIPERTLRRKLQSLSEKGYIEVTPRRRTDGTKTTSLIRLLASQTAKMAEGASTGQNGTSPPAKMAGQPPAICVAGQDSSGNNQEPSLSVGKKPKKGEYTAEFENEVWQPYPRKQGTSKLNAFKKWSALTPEEQQQIKLAIPAYARLMAGKDCQHHLEFFISRRIFETVGITDSAAKTSSPQAVFDRQTWENLSRIYANTSNWHRDWGPEPGDAGCKMPPDLQQQFTKFVNRGLTAH